MTTATTQPTRCTWSWLPIVECNQDHRAAGRLRLQPPRPAVLPRINITPRLGGWLASCTTCGWLYWKPGRLAVDQTAIDHYAFHAKGRGIL